MSDLYFMHHGIKGQKWGEKNGPPYPLNDQSHSNLERGKQIVDQILYHGSKADIKGKLKTNITYELQPLVYATNDYYYALVRAGNFDIHKPLIREEYDKGKRSLAELKSGAFKEVFDRPGYIYEVDNSKFRYNVGTEYISNEDADITKKHKIDNVWNEINKHKDQYELVSYEDPGDYWDHVTGGRDGYLERKRRYIKAVDDAIEQSKNKTLTEASK